MQKKTSDNGLNLIKCFEALRLKAYLDGAGVPTIGYGHTEDVAMGQTCTQAQADEWFADDVKWAEDAVNRYVENTTQNQFDALVSFTFNVGLHTLAKSETGHLFKIGKFEEAIARLAQYVHVTKNKFKEIETGLVVRRGIESYIFQKGYTPAVMLWIMAKEGK